MSERTIIVKISNKGVYFNPDTLLPLHNTNIPFNDLSFHTHADIYWQLEMISYNADKKCLKVRVIDYNAVGISRFIDQKPKSEIRMLHFEGKLDWPSLSSHLSYYQKIKLRETIDNLDKNTFSGMSDHPVADIPSVSDNILTLGSDHENVFIESFDIPFSEATIRAGYISFKRFVERVKTEVEFQISNSFLLPEFELIKFWFAKKLKTRKFRVYARITLVNNKVFSVDASSKEIYRINEDLIESIKFQRTLGFSKKACVIGVDKSLFTTGEIFDLFDEDEGKGNVFNQTEEEILKYFIDHSKIRNKQQLGYLAGKKQSEKNKLKFTLYPDFGFLFLVEGIENNHFVWELLNSNATYIWSFNSIGLDIKSQYQKIEEIINIIRANGRDNYKRAYKNNQINNNMVFKVIAHEDIGSNVVDHFPKWKNRLEEQLI